MGRLIDSRLFCHVTLVASLTCSICAFTKDKGKENNSEIKFTSRIDLVLIPALVTDKSGNH